MLLASQIQKFRALLAGPKRYTQKEAARRSGIPAHYDLSRVANGQLYKSEDAQA